MNFLDRTIGWFAPERGLKRAAARAAMQHMTRAYDGASTGRRNSNWTAPGTGPNAENRMALARLRNRASDIVRNTPGGAKAVRTIANNVAGTGITAESKATPKRLAKTIDEAWETWSGLECDIARTLTFGALQRQCVRAMVERGDVLVRRLPLPANSGRTVPLALQVLEGDFLDLHRQWNGVNPVVQGVELDANSGEPVAYWLWNRHPGEWIVNLAGIGLKSVRVPASDIIHLFEQDRPGQIRGMTRFASVIQTLRDIGDFDGANIVAKKIQACFAAFITSNAGPNGGPLLGIANPPNGQTADGSGNPVESFEPGMVARLGTGEDVKFATPPVTDGLADFHKIYDRQEAAGVGVMYEHLTGDLSDVNYSSFRAGHLEFRTDMECIRADVIVPKLCNRVWGWFVDAGVIAGLFAKADYSVEWTAPAWQSIDPLKDAQANRMDMRSGLLPPQKAMAQGGFKFDQVIADYATANAAYDLAGIVLDSDPRRVLLPQSGKGSPQAVEDVETDDPNGDTAAKEKPGV